MSHDGPVALEMGPFRNFTDSASQVDLATGTRMAALAGAAFICVRAYARLPVTASFT